MDAILRTKVLELGCRGPSAFGVRSRLTVSTQRWNKRSCGDGLIKHQHGHAQAMWKVMHVEAGEIKAIGKAAGPETPGAVLRIEEKDYEVLLSEGDRSNGWVYVTHLAVSRVTASE